MTAIANGTKQTQGFAGKIHPVVSVVVVSWNGRDLLRACLASVIAHTQGVSYELIVVDNASTDGAPDMVAEEFPQVTLLRQRINTGFAQGCNAGMAMASGRFLLLLNSDTLLLADSITVMMRYLETRPALGMCACTLLNPDRTLQGSIGVFPKVTAPLMNGLGLELFLGRLRHGRAYLSYPFLPRDAHERECEPDWLAGACMLLRREMLTAVGGMDENIFLYMEEIEWCFRSRQAGWRLGYTPATTLIHYGGGSTTTADPEKFAMILSSFRYFFRKHHGALAALAYTLLVLATAPFKILVGLVASALHPPQRAFYLNRVRLHARSIRWGLETFTSKESTRK